MYKIAVMGDRDSIYGFAALGLVPFSLTDPAEAGRKLRELAQSGYAVIYITESLAAQMEDAVKKSVEQAVGSDIIFNNSSEP